MALAATGIGAGDMVAAAVAGATYGTAILWVALYGAVLKLALNEGIARWQLATGTTLLEGWLTRLGKWTGVYFGIYLVLWSFIVAGALMAATGLAASALFGGLSVAAWGALHSVAALLLVWFGRYHQFERLMKGFIVVLFLVILYGAVALSPDWSALLSGMAVPRIPPGSTPLLLAVLGGVGGSVTMLSYGYWIREKGWIGKQYHRTVQVDLGAAYLLTGLFGVAMMVIASGVDGTSATGQQLILQIASQLEAVAGPLGRWSLLIGFWAAVFSSMIGVWHGVPYIFADGLAIWRAGGRERDAEQPLARSRPYRGYLIYLALPPMLLLLLGRPVWIIVAYAMMGALFMPFLAGTLLALNSRREWVGELTSGWLVKGFLWLSLILFGYLAGASILRQLTS